MVIDLRKNKKKSWTDTQSEAIGKASNDASDFFKKYKWWLIIGGGIIFIYVFWIWILVALVLIAAYYAKRGKLTD